MASWRLKAMAQGTLARLPHGHRLNGLWQRYVTKGFDLSADLFDGRLGKCHDHLRRCNEVRPEFGIPDLALEIGTGWFPIVPLGLFLCGVRRVITLDVVPLLSAERIRATARMYVEYAERGRLAELLPELRLDRLAGLSDLLAAPPETRPGALLERLDIVTVVRDSRDTGLDSGSVDCLVSNNTFEHISRELLVGVLTEGRRLLAPHGLASHYVDTSDHYAHADPSISEFNFYRFTDAQWQRYNNSIQFQNRLRCRDYRELLAETGYTILLEHNRTGSAKHLAKVPLAPQFRDYSHEDLLSTGCWFIAAPQVA